jgi:predicted permease
MDLLTQSIRSGVRLFRASPGLALSAVVALAMGIGFTTTMFSIVHGATRTLPFDRPEDIVAIEKIPAGQVAAGELSIRQSDVNVWQGPLRTIIGLSAYQPDSVNLSGDARQPERMAATRVTLGTFHTLGVTPQLGRDFLPEDTVAGAPAAVLISDAVWASRFGRAPDAVGRVLRVNGESRVIVGVMPPRFGFPINSALWLPLASPDALAPGTGERVSIVARLRPGVRPGDAGEELAARTRAAFADAGVTVPAVSVRLIPFTETETPREVIRALYVMVMAVSFVLLIACSNVANLLLARAAVKRQDTAVRLALGATRRHIIVAQFTEALMLSGVASVFGLIMAEAGTRLFAANTANIIEAFWVDLRVDPVVVAFASTLAIVATMASALAPALRASRTNLNDALAGSGRTSLRLGRLGRNLVAVQVSLAGGLLALTMILAQSSVQLRAVQWPYEPNDILTAEIGFTAAALNDPATRTHILDEVVTEIRAVPGVNTAALVSALPGRGGGNWSFALDRPSVDGADGATGLIGVTPEFLSVLGGHVVQGRAFTASDSAGAQPVALVNASFVARYSANRAPIGRQVFVGQRGFRIVGVVPDLMPGDIQDVGQDAFYVPMAQMRPSAVRLIARGEVAPSALVAPVRAAFARVDPDLPVTEFFSLYDAAFQDKRVLDVLSTLFLTFGAGALTLTAIGLYSVLSFSVTVRLREISIRSALGASRRQIVALVARESATQVGIGLAVGMALAVGLSRVFAAAVERVHPASAPVVVGIAAALAAVSILALIVPARRAVRVDVAQGLRSS